MKVKSLIWILVALGLVVLVFAMIGRPDKAKQSEAKAQKTMLEDRTIPVTFVTPQIRDLKQIIEITGSLKALHDVEVGAKVAGRLVAVNVREGSPVRRGQLLAQVEANDLYERLAQANASVEVAESARQQALLQAQISPQQSQANIRQAQAALSAAKSRLKQLREGARLQDRNQAKERVNDAKAKLDKTKADLERAKKLYAGDAISKADVDAAQFNYDSALAGYRTAVEALDAIVEGARPEELRQAEDAVSQAQEQLNIARSNSSNDIIRKQQLQQAEASLRQAQANVHLAQMQIADASIISPVDGYISGVPAQMGQVVNPGTPIATVVSLNDVYFSGQIPEKEISRVSPGHSAEVRMDAIPGRVFAGVVIAIDPRADSFGRLFAARISVAGGMKLLKPGMFGSATVTSSTVHGATTVPLDCIVSEDTKDYVFVANGDKAKRIEVRLGARDGASVQVSGVSTSEKVILGGKGVVSDGAKIREDKPEVKS